MAYGKNSTAMLIILIVIGSIFGSLLGEIFGNFFPMLNSSYTINGNFFYLWSANQSEHFHHFRFLPGVIFIQTNLKTLHKKGTAIVAVPFILPIDILTERKGNALFHPVH